VLAMPPHGDNTLQSSVTVPRRAPGPSLIFRIIEANSHVVQTRCALPFTRLGIDVISATSVLPREGVLIQ
jgi:hypothetical protein